MRILALLLVLWICGTCARENKNFTVDSNTSEVKTSKVKTTEVKTNEITSTESPTTSVIPSGCLCGVFLSGQIKKGSKEPPKGNPALLHEHDDIFPCTSIGNKLCTNKCLDMIVKHLPNSPAILCGSIDRDAYKERAYLFIKNCKNEWINTNLSAGREYCCKDGISYKCSLIS